jgi:ADP-ribose pyrophosphatase
MKNNVLKWTFIWVALVGMPTQALGKSNNDVVAQVRQRNEEVLKNSARPKGYPERFSVPHDKSSWHKKYPAYAPPYYVAGSVLEHSMTKYPNNPKMGWAEPEDFSQIDTAKNIEKSFLEVKYNEKGLPLNPFGRTGIAGRGLLGKWGPNFAADPIITRVMRDPQNPNVKRLEMLGIIRADTHLWAIPGGMVDAGEKASESAKRELKEETNIDLDMTGAEKIYEGYSADHRNTDNSWIETSVYHKHLSDEIAQKMEPEAIDPHEVKHTQWVLINEDLLKNMFATHAIFVRKVLDDYRNNIMTPENWTTKLYKTL